MSVRINIASLEDTQRAAHLLARHLQKEDCLLLLGEVGLGKTSFTRFLIHALQAEAEEVTSPTFTLVQPYEVELTEGRATLSHYDLYRLNEPHEIEELGLGDALEQGVAVIEWPEKAVDYMPKSALTLRFSAGSLEQERTLTVQATPDWQVRIQKWTEAYEQR